MAISMVNITGFFSVWYQPLSDSAYLKQEKIYQDTTYTLLRAKLSKTVRSTMESQMNQWFLFTYDIMMLKS
jgi:hypothetical protein